MLDVMSVDNDFISLLGLQWRQQPAIPEELYDDKHILINETAIEKLGLQGGRSHRAKSRHGQPGLHRRRDTKGF